jgi:RHS repeat-associated protein
MITLGWYYLNSRYYDPNNGRFTAPDNPTVLVMDQEALMQYNLFSYCQNNPIMMLDTSGLLPVSAIWFRGFRTIFWGCDRNKRYNDTFVTDGYINGQDGYGYCRLGYSNMAYAECEIIAVYNALKYIGRRIPLSSIIYRFEKNGYIMTYGYFGSDPYAIGEYLGSNGVSYQKYTSYNGFSNVVYNSQGIEIFIVSFWNEDSIGGGLHTVAFYVCNGKIYSYNRFSDKTSIMIFPSFSKLFSSAHFIVGYRIRGR